MISLEDFKPFDRFNHYYVYLLMFKGEVVYVGMSLNPSSRLASHVGRIQWDETRLQFVGDVADATELEAACIRHWNPKHNFQHNENQANRVVSST